MKKEKDKPGYKYIKCPVCGREYMTGEIFLPYSFVGQPTDIVRGYDENILMYEGTDMDLKEEYICDKCNTKLNIKAVVTFKVEQAKDFFDDDSYVSEEK